MQKSGIRNLCNCPSLLLAVGGPWLCVMGGVITKDVIVQRLTSMEWVAYSSTEEDARVLKVASILWAVRQCSTELAAFYQGLADPVYTIPLDDTHPRFYPTPTTFQFRGETIAFRYLVPMQSFASCVTYKAEITQVPRDCEGLSLKKGSFVVVKFVSRYGEEAHRLLAKHAFAPALHYCGEVPEWKAAVKALSPPVNPKVPGLVSAISHMVVMDLVEASRTDELDPGERGRQVAKILCLLHLAGYVFGDLRPPNVLLETRTRCIKFIDFNWAGLFDPRNLEGNSEGVPICIQEGIKLKAKGAFSGHPTSFPLNIRSAAFNNQRLGLAPILPRHDWAMWRLHFRGNEDESVVDLVANEVKYL
jgi:hypothetical protein